MTHKCKRIIEGKTYNTETAIRIAGRDDGDFGRTYGEYLYQSRFGAFFEYRFLDGADEDDYERINPLTPDEARKWLEEKYGYEPELIEQYFGEMPEAGSGEAKVTLRMPEILRKRLAEKAKANNQSLNAWAVRLLEIGANDGDNL